MPPKEKTLIPVAALASIKLEKNLEKVVLGTYF